MIDAIGVACVVAIAIFEIVTMIREKRKPRIDYEKFNAGLIKHVELIEKRHEQWNRDRVNSWREKCLKPRQVGFNSGNPHCNESEKRMFHDSTEHRRRQGFGE